MSNEFDPEQLLEFYPFTTEEIREERRPIELRHGASPWELSILEAIWFGFGMVPRCELGERCHGIYQSQFPRESQRGVDRCFENEWVQVIAPEFIQQMKSELEAGGYLITGGLFDSSTCDEQCIGLAHFTRKGLGLYREWSGPSHSNVDEFWTSVREPGSVWAIYANSLEAFQKSLEEYTQPFELIEAPRSIGRWCSRWWNRFERGVVARIRTTEFD